MAEISAVDRPAQAHALEVIMKRADQADRDRLLALIAEEGPVTDAITDHVAALFDMTKEEADRYIAAAIAKALNDTNTRNAEMLAKLAPTAADEMAGKAEEYRKAQIALGKKGKKEMAFAEIYADPEHRELAKRFNAEDIAKRAETLAKAGAPPDAPQDFVQTPAQVAARVGVESEITARARATSSQGEDIEMNRLASVWLKDNPQLSKEQAYDQVFTHPANRGIRQQMRGEDGTLVFAY
jgi:hypothetical protein